MHARRRSTKKTTVIKRSRPARGRPIARSLTGSGIPAGVLIRQAGRVRRSLAANNVLQLQQTIGNRATARILNQPSRATAQLALDATQVKTLQGRAAQLDTRLNVAINRLPAVIGNKVPTDAIMDPIRTVSHKAKNEAATADFNELKKTLAGAEAAIVVLEGIITRHQDDFDAIGRMYTAVPAGNRDAKFADLKKEFENFAEQIATDKVSQAQVNKLRTSVEKVLIPDNKQMQKMRRDNAQEAMDLVAILVQAEMAEVSSLMSLYESEFDRAEDHFGGAWKLQPAASTGRLQWVRQWEFHIHATVQRGGPASHVTGFNIHRAHIKPSSGARAVGVSIQITNQTLLNNVQNDFQRQITNWSTTREGLSVLKKTKRQ